MTEKDRQFEGSLELVTPRSESEVRRDPLVASLLDAALGCLSANETYVLLRDERGELGIAGASSPNAKELAQASLVFGGPGPWAATAQAFADLGTGSELWPQSLVSAAARHRLHVCYAVPLTVGDRLLGAYVLWWRSHGVPEERRRYADAIGRVAAVGLMNQLRMNERDLVVVQLQHALTSRIVIEQAKGMVAERHSIDVDSAFELLRDRARSGRRSLSSVAADVVGPFQSSPRIVTDASPPPH